MPAPEWPAFASKFVALLSSIAIILAIAMVTAILVQFFHHFHRHQIGLVHCNPVWNRFQPVHFPFSSGVFYPCAFAQQVRGILCISLPSRFSMSLSGGRCMWRQTWSSSGKPRPWSTPISSAMPRSQRLGMVHPVLGCILPGAGGGDPAIVAARTRNALEQPLAECAACASMARCGLWPPSGWLRSSLAAYGSTTTPKC